MALPVYLAMTQEEMCACGGVPEHFAYMACHFSPYGQGLCNLPQSLPKDAVLIVNDRIPLLGHDPERIAAQLQKICDTFHPTGVLLDFQREERKCKVIAEAVAGRLSCPVGVTPEYAGGLDCPVFLGPVPLHRTLSSHIAPWTGREVWLEAALDRSNYTVTENGCTIENCAGTDPLPFCDEQLHCHYGCSITKDRIVFTLQRTREDLQALLENTEGVTKVIGLFQELRE